MFSCLGMSTDLSPASFSLSHSLVPLSPSSSLFTFSFVKCFSCCFLCAKAFCLISRKHQSRESKRNYLPELHEKKEQMKKKERKVQVG